MANKERGESGFEAGGKSYVLRFTANALCDLEASLGEPTGQIVKHLADPESMSLTTLRAFVWAGLRATNPELTVEGAGEVMTAYGINPMIGLIGRAFEAAFPQNKGNGAEARPRRETRPGIGGVSSSGSSKLA